MSTCSVSTIVNLYQVWTDISCYTLLPKWPVFGSKHRSTDHLHGNECCSSVSTGHLIVNRYTCKSAMLDICELFYTFKNYQLHIKWYQQICTILLYPIANILSYNDAISRLINTHKLAVVQLWTELSFCCGSIFCRLYIYIGTVFFFIGQWDWFVIAFLWSVIPLDSRLQSSTSDVMYTCKPILAFKVRFHAPLSPRRAPSKKYQSGSGKFCSTDSHSCVIY